MITERSKQWLPGIAIALMASVAVFALCKGLVRTPVRIDALTVRFYSGRIFATTTVSNDTAKPLNITVHFELCHSTRDSRMISPAMTLTPYDVVTHLDAHTSHSVSCDFFASGQQDQSTVTAVISKYE